MQPQVALDIAEMPLNQPHRRARIAPLQCIDDLRVLVLRLLGRMRRLVHQRDQRAARQQVGQQLREHLVAAVVIGRQHRETGLARDERGKQVSQPPSLTDPALYQGGFFVFSLLTLYMVAPLAAAVALEALDVLLEERLAERAATLGPYMLDALRALRCPAIREVRGKGLLIGVDLDPALASARTACERLLAHGILSKDTHQTVVRFAPPLVITRDEIAEALEGIGAAFSELGATNA